MKTIKVLQVLDYINSNSGVSSVVMNYYTHMEAENIKFDFLLFEEPDEEWSKKLKASDADIYVTGQPSGSRIGTYIKNVDEFFRVHGAEYQIVHVHIPNCAFAILKSAKKYGVPVRILHSHNSRGADGIVKKVRNFILNKQGIVYANQYFACSKSAGEYLYGKKVCQQGKVTVLHNAVQIDKFRYSSLKRRKIRDELGLGDEVLIGHIGRFSEQKNHECLVDIFAKLCYYGWDGKMVLLGDGELRKAIEEKVKKLKLENRILFLGVVENVDEYLSAMDVFLLPSLYEGLPVVCVEAQVSGLSCLVSDKVSYEVKISENIEFFDICNIDGCCKQIQKIEIDEEKRQQAGENAWENFDIIKQTARLEKLYHSFCEKDNKM